MSPNIVTLDAVEKQLKTTVGDDPLIDNLFLSYRKISEGFVAQNPVALLQNAGLFVESSLRVIEHLIFTTHTPLKGILNVDAVVTKLEKASGSEGLRIHAGRLTRIIYDFRTRKKAVHLKAIDPEAIDASLIFNIATWIMIEILKEGGIPGAEDAIRLLFTTKTPLVQRAGGVLRTTNPKLSGPQRILLLLYTEPSGLTEDQLLSGTKNKIKDKNHLKTNLRTMDNGDLVHYSDGKWALFGKGFVEAEELIKFFS